MESTVFSRNTKSGCTLKATKTNNKTAQISNIDAAKEATPPFCSSRKISSHRPLTLLLITMTLVTLATHLPGSTTAAAISTSSSEEQQQQQQQQTLLDDVDAADTSLELAHYVQKAHNAADQVPWRTRLRKRHANHLYWHQHRHASESQLEWENPCGGTFIGRPESEESDVQMQRQTKKQHMKDLRNAVKHQYNEVDSFNHIQIDDIAEWQVHQNQYKFLPRLKPDSKIKLKLWYRNMQTYVASFAHLGRTQYSWDLKNYQKASDISDELDKLFRSARMLLCEIETAINGSYPQSSKSKLTATSRSEMNARLKFRTHTDDVRDVDLKYAKHHYIAYVKQMLNVLRKNSKSKQRTAASYEDPDLSMNSELVDESGSSSASESSEILIAETTTHRSSKKSGQNRGQKRRQQHPRQHKNNDQQ